MRAVIEGVQRLREVGVEAVIASLGTVTQSTADVAEAGAALTKAMQ